MQDRTFAQLDRKVRAGQVLTMDEVRLLAPSAFAEGAAPTTSQRYRYIPTSEPLNALVRSGFQIVGAGESKTRIAGNEDYVRHMVKLRHPDMAKVDGVIPQVALLNSHNGTSAYHLFAGVWRTICSNGLISVTAEFASIRVLHTGARDIAQEVLNAAVQISERIPLVLDQVGEWQTIQWNDATMTAFAVEVLKLRWDNPPIEAWEALAAKRSQDRGNNVWVVMNRLQENLTKGGQRYYRNGRSNSTRAISSVNADLAFNTKLWKLTDRWARGDYATSEEVVDAEYSVIE